MLQGGQLHRRFSGHVAAMRQASFPALNLLRGATSYPMATTPPAAAAVSAFESEASASHTDASSDFSFPQALSANDKHPGATGGCAALVRRSCTSLPDRRRPPAAAAAWAFGSVRLGLQPERPMLTRCHTMSESSSKVRCRCRRWSVARSVCDQGSWECTVNPLQPSCSFDMHAAFQQHLQFHITL